jgi:hypothetical protein
MILKKLVGFFYTKSYFSVFLTLLVAFLCFMPSQELPDGPDDKTAHFLAFGVLSFSWLMYQKSYLRTIWLLSAFAILIEIVQYCLPAHFHRSFDLLDIFADVVGVFMGLAVGFLLYKIMK